MLHIKITTKWLASGLRASHKICSRVLMITVQRFSTLIPKLGSFSSIFMVLRLFCYFQATQFESRETYIILNFQYFSLTWQWTFYKIFILPLAILPPFRAFRENVEKFGYSWYILYFSYFALSYVTITVNGICCKIFPWMKSANYVHMIFRPCYYIGYLQNKSHASSGPMELSRDLFSTRGKRKLAILEVFRAYLMEFSLFRHKIYIVARSY